MKPGDKFSLPYVVTRIATNGEEYTTPEGEKVILDNRTGLMFFARMDSRTITPELLLCSDDLHFLKETPNATS